MIHPPQSPRRRLPRPGCRYHFARCTLRCLVALALGYVVAPAHGQNPPRPPVDLPPLARFVPDNTGFFVEIDGLLDLGALLREQNLWAVVEDLLGSESDQGGWPAALAANLGVESTSSMLRLFRERVALAAPDWQRLSHGVIVFTSVNPKFLDAIVHRPGTQQVSMHGPVRVFRTGAGMWLAQRGSAVVMARRRGEGAIFNRCISLLGGEASSSLASVEAFRTCMQDLGAPRLLWAYWSSQSKAKEPDEPVAGWWPGLKRGALAVRRRDELLEIALRGTPERAVDTRYVPRVRLDRLGALPQLTLAVWATSIDPRERFAELRSQQPPDDYAPLWRLLAQGGDAESFEADVVSKIGPRCMLMVGANFRRPTLDPQMALLIESVDAVSVVEALRIRAASLVESAGDNGEPRFTLGLDEYFGVPIQTLTWERNGTKSTDESLAGLVARGMTPAAAAIDGWVVLATSTDLIHDLIDARNGLTQRLADILPADRGQLGHAGDVAVLQPVLTQSMVHYWGAVLNEDRRMRRGQSRLGVEVPEEPTPGAVVVEMVDSNGPAAELLTAGDVIFACNGQLLEMQGALAHLQVMASAAAGGSDLTLRVMRDGRIVEVALPIAPEDTPTSPEGLGALAAPLAPLESIAQAISTAVLAVERPNADGYRAQITLQFAGAARPQPSPKPVTEIPPE